MNTGNPQNKLNSEIGRTAISEIVRMKLWAISAGRCEICNRLLYSDIHFGLEGNFGELAHIHAVSVGGPRHKKGMSSEEKNNIDNLMLLCGEHHHQIDHNPKDYSDGLLMRLKKQHESRIRAVTEITEDQSCRIVTYFSNIDSIEVFSSERILREATISAGLFSKQEPIISLHKDTINRFIPTKEAFENKASELEYQYKQWLDSLKEQDTIAVFSLAPQPLLFKLGTLITDQLNVRVFQCHRFGNKWALKDNAEPVDYIFEKRCFRRDSKKVALVMDLSAPISDLRIKQAIGEANIYHITIPSPNRYFVLTQNIQDSFVTMFRNAMEKIKEENLNCKTIEVFMAMPNSLVIRAGMDYMPKSDLPLVLYEQANENDGYFETITIGG